MVTTFFQVWHLQPWDMETCFKKTADILSTICFVMYTYYVYKISIMI